MKNIVIAIIASISFLFAGSYDSEGVYYSNNSLSYTLGPGVNVSKYDVFSRFTGGRSCYTRRTISGNSIEDVKNDIKYNCRYNSSY